MGQKFKRARRSKSVLNLTVNINHHNKDATIVISNTVRYFVIRFSLALSGLSIVTLFWSSEGSLFRPGETITIIDPFGKSSASPRLRTSQRLTYRNASYYENEYGQLGSDIVLTKWILRTPTLSPPAQVDVQRWEARVTRLETNKISRRIKLLLERNTVYWKL